ncbi:MAG: aminotransferase class I/II-fold pyridoxal phosphate-dependent enzyme [Clostridia bacterium]|nr:aminotransferase class I/II-fold pyridoxal phosphate-dependent enzyme [Clostridia bacterium]
MDYSKLISKTLMETKPSGIRKFFGLVSKMQDVTALTVGQPDFVTPWHVREAAIESLESGKTYYTSNSGLRELRDAISAYMKRRFDLEYDAHSEIFVTVGGSEAIDVAMRAVINPGDEVIVPMPSFVCYEPMARMAGANVVTINTKAENSFKLTPDELRAAITPRTKLLVLPYPNNPTGAILKKEELEALAAVLRDTNILVLSDEIYAELTYGNKHVSIASVEGMWERTIVASGFSKAYAMTGWRLGYLCAPAPLLSEMLKLHQYAIMCAPTVSQFAAIEAMNNGDDDIARMCAEYNRRRIFIHEGLESIGIPSFMPEGAFYIYPDISGYGLSSEEFCEKLLYEEKCAIVPGTAFGDCGEGFARISYAYSVKHITEALEKMERFVKKLKK